MSFVQVIDFTTSRYDEVGDIMDQWTAATREKRTPTRWLIGRDRDRANHFIEVVEFASYDAAMRNNALPETQMFSQRISDVCDDVVFTTSTTSRRGRRG
jgi:hypothetical protein